MTVTPSNPYRAESVPISHPEYGTAWIRDNRPINQTVLRRTLVGMTEAEWYRTLNGRVFFWLSEQRLEKLRGAGAYRGRKHDILTLDTEALLNVYADQVELAPMNTGAVHGGAKVERGTGTFQPIASYPWEERVRINRTEPVVELTIPYAVLDVPKFVLDVSTR
jgi:hypothetical protein